MVMSSRRMRSNRSRLILKSSSVLASPRGHDDRVAVGLVAECGGDADRRGVVLVGRGLGSLGTEPEESEMQHRGAHLLADALTLMRLDPAMIPTRRSECGRSWWRGCPVGRRSARRTEPRTEGATPRPSMTIGCANGTGARCVRAREKARRSTQCGTASRSDRGCPWPRARPDANTSSSPGGRSSRRGVRIVSSKSGQRFAPIAGVWSAGSANAGRFPRGEPRVRNRQSVWVSCTGREDQLAFGGSASTTLGSVPSNLAAHSKARRSSSLALAARRCCWRMARSACRASSRAA